MTGDGRAAFGRRGEDAACAELQRRGYVIVERNFRTRFGELDVIARDGAVLVFVEVRARSSGSFGHPLESVTWQKQRRVSRMAASYLFARRLADVPCRFDVAAVTPGPAGGLAVEVLRAAFDLSR